MSVYFFYRCPYEGPTGSRLRRFGDDTVLDWFRARWHAWGGADVHTVYDRVEREMECEVYSFAALFAEAAREAWPAPTTAQELTDAVGSAVYHDQVLCPSPHLLQVSTDDDEVGLAYCFFDDHYLARHSRRTAFLLRDGWQLPDGAGSSGFRPKEKTHRLKPRGPGAGATYVIDLDHVNDMDDLSLAYRVDGVRLPDLMRYLACQPWKDQGGHLLQLPRDLLTVEPAGADATEVGFVRHLREFPADELAWTAYSDWLQERGEQPAGLHLLRRTLGWAGRWYDTDRPNQPYPDSEDLVSLAHWAQPEVAALERSNLPSQSLVHVGNHVAQLALHYDVAKRPKRVRHYYHEWIYFDDLWAAAHTDLANAILRYVRRWDVLTPGQTRVEEA